MRGVRGKVDFTVKRGREFVDVQVPVRPQPLITDRRGLLVDGALISQDTFAQRRAAENLLYVHSVGRGSPANGAGIYPTYRLFMSNRSPVRSLAELEKNLEGAPATGKHQLIFRKRGSARNTLYEHGVIQLSRPSIRWITFPKAKKTRLSVLRARPGVVARK